MDLAPCPWTIPGTVIAELMTQVVVEAQSRHPAGADVGLEEGKPRGTQACAYTYIYIPM